MTSTGTPMDSETVAKLVTNSHLVTDIYGRWPSFHDSEVLSLSLDANGHEPSLDLHVYVYERIPDANTKGRLKSANEYRLALRFTAITNLELDGFNHQNVLSDLYFDRRDESLHVLGETIYGLQIEFDCTEIMVASVEPYERPER